MKKTLKIIGIFILIFTVILVAIPLVLQSKIDTIVKAYVEKNVNAHVEFEDVSLSLLSSFPKANVTIDNLKITNTEPFKDEIFATVKSIELDMAIKELFKNQNDEAISIKSISIDEALLTLKLNATGTANYDIIKEEKNGSEDQESEGFKFNIEDYKISNSTFTYINEKSNTIIYVSKLNHSGKGTFSDTVSELETKSEAIVSFDIDSTSYLKNNQLTLDALIDLDLKNNTYTFKDNKGYINLLPLEFHGYLQLKEDSQFIDLSFNNPESSFKDFLAVIPEQYSKNLDHVETSGNFIVNGVIKGLLSENTIPTLDINIASTNASFKYPDLPKRVENITVNAAIKNDNGKSDDTYININTLNFKIDKDVFKSSATIKNLTKNIFVNANIDGSLNLANISKVYPIEPKNELSGILKGKLNTSFDIKALETNSYERINNKGNITINDFIFSSEDFVNPININDANMNFNSGTVSLTSFNAQTGSSDISATGTITNLLGFLLSDKKLQGHFNVNSNNFVVSDFMVEDETLSEENKTTNEEESLKIPDFLDCTINANVKNVLYDNLNLKNVTGILYIKDQQATLKDIKSNLFDGTLNIDGTISTQHKTPTFNFNLGADAFDISKSFQDLELLQTLAPIAKVLHGKLNSTLKISGTLNEKFTLDLKTIKGNMLAEVLTSSFNPLQAEVLSRLGAGLDFIDFNKLGLNDLKTKLDFEKGLVRVHPFNFKYQDIDIEVSGTHSFDKLLDYNMVFNVPAKYLGSEVNSLISKINDPEVNTITIPVTANISGSYDNPVVVTDLTRSIGNLTQQLIEIEKQKLLNTGKDKIKDLLGGLFNNANTETNTSEADSLKVDSSSIQIKDPIKKGVEDVLGGLLGKKKKKKKKKDSIN